MEEERRLCYVGITRARYRLHLSYAKRRTVFGQTRYQRPSRFLKEIPEECYHDGCRPQDERSKYADVDQTDFAAGGGRVFGSRGGTPAFPRPGAASPRPAVPERPRADLQALVDRARNQQKGQFQPGNRVRHAHFGDGIVTRSVGSGDDEEVSVIFPKHGEKKLIVGYAKLEKL
jgi:DNA helicase-2/ATP-dependent DNA helicase PcrA